MTSKQKKRRIAAIIERDGSMCWLCGKPVDCTADWRIGPLAPTIDHVIPSSRGGSDDLDNLKLAHAVCNTARGDRPPTEQYEE